MAPGKCSHAVFQKVRVGTCYLSLYILTLGHSRRPVCSFDPKDPSFRSFKVIWGHISFLPLTFVRIEIERWGWSQYVSLAQTHRLIWNITYLSRRVTSRDLDLRSNSDIDPLRPICTYIFRRVSSSGTRCCQNYVTSFLSSNVICEKPFSQKKTLFWPFVSCVA